MRAGLEEFKEFIRIRENVRNHANALELCSDCQKITECRRVLRHNTLEWLCDECRAGKSQSLFLLRRKEEFLCVHASGGGLRWQASRLYLKARVHSFLRRLGEMKMRWEAAGYQALRRYALKRSRRKGMGDGTAGSNPLISVKARRANRKNNHRASRHPLFSFLFSQGRGEGKTAIKGHHEAPRA